jgi:diadenosine tetraphosphate (Ap4A) HIT family hydrolase
VKTYTHWSLYLRSRVKTLGTSALITNEHFSKMSEIPEVAFTELHAVTRQLEMVFDQEFHPDKYNYQMNMMKESHTHFNIFPRYSKTTTYLNTEWQDTGWPLLVGENLAVEQSILEKVAEVLRSKFNIA